MTKAHIKEATQNVVIPASVALGILALAAKAIGILPSLNDPAAANSALANRLTAVESRQIEMERQWREDRNELLRVIYDVQGAVKRIEGKLER